MEHNTPRFCGAMFKHNNTPRFPGPMFKHNTPRFHGPLVSRCPRSSHSHFQTPAFTQYRQHFPRSRAPAPPQIKRNALLQGSRKKKSGELKKFKQHENGYSDVISKLQNTEDIEKWREERRKNFPTAENIQKCKAEQAEKEARGEILETKEFGKFQQRGGLKSNDNRRKRPRFNNHPVREKYHNHPSTRPFVFHIDSESDSDSDSHITLKPFAGMSSLTKSPKVINGNSSIEVGSSSCVDDITNSRPAWFLNEQNLPSSKKDLSVQNVLQTDSSASNVMDLDETPILSNNSMASSS